MTAVRQIPSGLVVHPRSLVQEVRKQQLLN